MYRTPRANLTGDGFTQSMDIEAFRRRQEADLQRYAGGETVVRRRPFHERYKHLAKPIGAYDEGEETPSEDEEDEEEEELRGRASKRFSDEGEEA